MALRPSLSRSRLPKTYPCFPSYEKLGVADVTSTPAATTPTLQTMVLTSATTTSQIAWVWQTAWWRGLPWVCLRLAYSWPLLWCWCACVACVAGVVRAHTIFRGLNRSGMRDRKMRSRRELAAGTYCEYNIVIVYYGITFFWSFLTLYASCIQYCTHYNIMIIILCSLWVLWY